jgi:hypothetical protein
MSLLAFFAILTGRFWRPSRKEERKRGHGAECSPKGFISWLAQKDAVAKLLLAVVLSPHG